MEFCEREYRDVAETEIGYHKSFGRIHGKDEHGEPLQRPHTFSGHDVNESHHFLVNPIQNSLDPEPDDG